MPSAIWTGAISFGLVQVPVKLVGATKNKDVSFNQLEKGTGARIRYRKVSDATGDEVTADQIERGFEVSKGRYVIVEPSEIETLRPKGGHEIEIEEFVDLDDIDPLYFEQPYYLVPDKRGEKPYALLVDAMQSLNKVAIGRVVMRSKERLVAIRPLDGALCVETMRYADEVVPVNDLVPETDAELSEKETHDGAPTRGVARGRGVRAREVPRPVPRAVARSHHAQGVGRGDHRRAADRGAGEGARPRRRARGVDREVEDREGSSPDRRGHPRRSPRRRSRPRREGATKSTAKATKAPAKKAARVRSEAPDHATTQPCGPARARRAARSAAGGPRAVACSSSSQPQPAQTGDPARSGEKSGQGSHRVLTGWSSIRSLSMPRA